ncbi:response regulator, partial [Oxalobacteraceae bacterium OM1]
MLAGYYDLPLVLVSVLVAVFASYTTLSLAGRVTISKGRTAFYWTAGGALAMGIGIWSMHFIGMLAFRLPIPVGFDVRITLLSLLLPISVSYLALSLLGKPELPLRRLLTSSLLFGLGINAMHYTGMAAMRMEPGIVYEPRLFAASVGIAVAASLGSLWIAFRLRGNVPHVWLPRLAAAVVMGGAVVGMHYVGMAAANFPLGSVCRAAGNGVNHDWLAVMVIIATLGILTVALLTSVFDARLESRNRVLALLEDTAQERQHLLAREQAARAEAERHSKAKDEFLATLSHELRTPLSAILGWAQLLQARPHDAASLKKGLETIERNANLQAQLINDLLDMSRIVSGKVPLNLQEIDARGFIDAAIETVAATAASKGVEFATRIETQGALLCGDAVRLQQVVWNLLANAVKFSAAGGRVSVTARCLAHQLEITVADDGIGIAPEFLPQIFDRFTQADASATRQHGGLGLGLAIVKHLVELHHGTVGVVSAGAGKGACFSVRLPLIAGHAGSAARADGDAASAGIHGTVALAGRKVLLVDDDPDALAMLEQLLGDHGVATATAASAEDALRLFAAVQPDVVVSDIGMPRVDGYALMRCLREQHGHAVPAIALTAFARRGDR